VSAVARDAGQLLWVGFDGTAAPAELRERIRAGEVSGVILFARNIVSVPQVAELVSALGAAPPPELPVVLAVDQEGGRVQRLRAPLTEWPPMARLGARGDPELAHRVGLALGRELRALGFNCDFAPVLDVHTNPANPVIGDRSLASHPDTVGRLGVALLRGLEAGGVLGCVKHFPGHGDTSHDSHLELPRVAHAEERLRRVELVPFARAVREGVRLIMTAHVVCEAFDATQPATLSRRIMQELLRDELGYRGVVVSDDLEMKAIADHYGVEDAAVRVVRAGVDVLLCCHARELQDRVLRQLIAEGERDSGFRERLSESAGRVATLRRSLARFEPIDPTTAARAFPIAEHHTLAASFA
jgi:beta-N-acetylhexosaminidase